MLTPKKLRFVEEYLLDLNATQAAMRAGYSERTAKAQGARLLTDVDVQMAIQAAQGARSERTEVTADRVVTELVSLALYDPADLVRTPISGPADIANLPEVVRRAIIGWSWDKQGRFTLKLSPKTPSIELLGRHIGMFPTKMEHSGPNGGAIPVDATVRAAEVRSQVLGLLGAPATPKDDAE